jgi:CspA family cold shock protein
LQQFKEGDTQSMSEKTQGTVKWFSRAKGYGFIQPDGAPEDVFVHYSAIAGDGFRNLQRGERVEFAIEDTAKGPQAIDVVQLAFGEMEGHEDTTLDSQQPAFEETEELEETAPESEPSMPNIGF